MKIKCKEDVMIVRSIVPAINLKFKIGEVKDVSDEVGKILLEKFPDKFEEIKEE